MFQSDFDIFLVILAGIILATLPFVNYFYQKRADEFADNLLLEIPEEYNKQIKANAYRYLISRIIFGLFFACIGIYSFWTQPKSNYWFIILYLIFAIWCFAWAIYGYKSEIEKI